MSALLKMEEICCSWHRSTGGPGEGCGIWEVGEEWGLGKVQEVREQDNSKEQMPGDQPHGCSARGKVIGGLVGLCRELKGMHSPWLAVAGLGEVTFGGWSPQGHDVMPLATHMLQ